MAGVPLCPVSLLNALLIPEATFVCITVLNCTPFEIAAPEFGRMPSVVQPFVDAAVSKRITPLPPGPTGMEITSAALAPVIPGHITTPVTTHTKRMHG